MGQNRPRAKISSQTLPSGESAQYQYDALDRLPAAAGSAGWSEGTMAI